jgi:hypothetical protein
MKKYFVIYFGEDGISISSHTKKEVEEMVNDETQESEFVDGTAKEYSMDETYPIYKIMIIKGEVVLPKPIEVITKFEIE